jgi:hypothetical protein
VVVIATEIQVSLVHLDGGYNIMAV